LDSETIQHNPEGGLLPNKQEFEATYASLEGLANPLIALDLALLKITNAGSTKFPYLTLGDSAQVHSGDTVKAVGYPSTLGGDRATTQGTITNETRQSRTVAFCGSAPTLQNLLATNRVITYGNSGGPLLKRHEQRGEDEVIGLVNALIGGQLAYATEINTAIEKFIPLSILPRYLPEVTKIEMAQTVIQDLPTPVKIVFRDLNRDVVSARIKARNANNVVVWGDEIYLATCCSSAVGKIAGEIPVNLRLPITLEDERSTLEVRLQDTRGLGRPTQVPFLASSPRPEIVGRIEFPLEIQADGNRIARKSTGNTHRRSRAKERA
jgi:hypothetical protein